MMETNVLIPGVTPRWKRWLIRRWYRTLDWGGSPYARYKLAAHEALWAVERLKADSVGIVFMMGKIGREMAKEEEDRRDAR